MVVSSVMGSSIRCHLRSRTYAPSRDAHIAARIPFGTCLDRRAVCLRMKAPSCRLDHLWPARAGREVVVALLSRQDADLRPVRRPPAPHAESEASAAKDELSILDPPPAAEASRVLTGGRSRFDVSSQKRSPAQGGASSIVVWAKFYFFAAGGGTAGAAPAAGAALPLAAFFAAAMHLERNVLRSLPCRFF